MKTLSLKRLIKNSLFLSLFSLSLGQIGNKTSDLNFIFANNGYGFGFETTKQQNEVLQVGLDLRLYDIRRDEYTTYNEFYNQFGVIGEKSILMIPVYGRINYLLFQNKIANNFKPYIFISAGALIAVDGNENERSFRKKWFEAETQVVPSFSTGFGVDFNSIGQGNSISLGLGYDYFKTKEPIHNKDDYGGIFLYLKYRIKSE